MTLYTSDRASQETMASEREFQSGRKTSFGGVCGEVGYKGRSYDQGRPISSNTDLSTRLSIDTAAAKYFTAAMIYMAAALALALFGAVYEYFSHGVFSFYMIYAFMIPLVFGAIPYLAAFIRRIRGSDARGIRRHYSGNTVREMLYHAGVATLTVGSIMQGVLEIYGTTNKRIFVYPVIGASLIIAYTVSLIYSFRNHGTKTSGIM